MNENYILSSQMSRYAMPAITITFYTEQELQLQSTAFWDVKPCSLVEVYVSFGGSNTSNFRVEENDTQASSKHNEQRVIIVCFLLVVYVVYAHSSTLKMETCYSETSVNFHRITWDHIPEYSTLHTTVKRISCQIRTSVFLPITQRRFFL